MVPVKRATHSNERYKTLCASRRLGPSCRAAARIFGGAAGLCADVILKIIDRMSKGSPLPHKTQPKILSTDPSTCTVTLTDLFEANERRSKKPSGRI